MVVLAEIVAVGAGRTVTVTEPVAAWLQPPCPGYATFTNVKVVVSAKALVTEIVPEDGIEIVVSAVPLLYVTTVLGVPVKVTVALSPEHTVATFAETLTTGGGTNVIVAVAVCGCGHGMLPEADTLTRAKVVVAL
jgi:hypothetical protein